MADNPTDEHCRPLGRDPRTIQRSVLVGGDPRTIGEPLRAMGVSLFIVLLHAPDELEQLRQWIGWRDRVNTLSEDEPGGREGPTDVQGRAGTRP